MATSPVDACDFIEFLSKDDIFIDFGNAKTKEGNSVSKRMLEVLKLFLDFYPDADIMSVVRDENAGGFKLCFEKNEAYHVNAVIKNQNFECWRPFLYPSTTCLGIYDIDLTEEMVKKRIIKEIEKEFGKVLSLVPKRENHYIACIAISENRNLKAFKNISSIHRDYKVSFWCRDCKRLGHTLKDCDGSLKPDTTSDNPADLVTHTVDNGNTDDGNPCEDEQVLSPNQPSPKKKEINFKIFSKQLQTLIRNSTDENGSQAGRLTEEDLKSFLYNVQCIKNMTSFLQTEGYNAAQIREQLVNIVNSYHEMTKRPNIDQSFIRRLEKLITRLNKECPE